MSSPQTTRRSARQATQNTTSYKESSDESDNASHGSEFGNSRQGSGLKRKRGQQKHVRSTKRRDSVGSKLSDLTPLTSPEPSQSQPTEADTQAGRRSTMEEKLGWRWVWLRIDREGLLVKGHDRESFWWPAKVQSASMDDKPLDIIFFHGLGTMPPALNEVTSNMMLPFFDTSGTRRFTAFSDAVLPPRVTYAAAHLGTGNVKEDNHFTHSDLHQRWLDAVKALERDAGAPSGSVAPTVTSQIPDIDLTLETSSDEELPDVHIAHSKSFNPNTLFRRRHHSFSTGTGDDYTSMGSLYTTGTEDAAEITGDSSWELDKPDPNISIPGEGVLARTQRKANEYWPARVMEFLPGTKTRRSRYRVQWFDNTPPQLLPRTHFYIQEEEEFYTCPLGAMKGGKQVKDTADDENYDNSEFRRYPSPLPTLPPPPPPEFMRLDMRTRFQYLKPVMNAILSDIYTPARPRHNDFIAGGKRRLAVTKRACNKGNLSVPEYHQLERCLRWWCLREKDGRSEGDVVPLTESHELDTSTTSVDTTHDVLSHAVDDITTNTTTTNVQIHTKHKAPPRPPPPQGCPEYESLSPIHKIEYCMNVLLPEAVIQLLLWHFGKRTTPELQPEEDESNLWSIGNKLSEQEDWVWQIINNRQKRHLKPTMPAKKVKLPAVAGRPRRSTRT